MKIYNLIMIFYILASALIGTIILSFSLHLVSINDIVLQLNELYTNINARISLTATGVLIILIGFLFAQIISVKHEREKTIAFNNPQGQVTITLRAVEDLIKKIGQELPEIKEIKPYVIATRKKGLLVDLRLILKSETNIPDFTSELQNLIKNKIQEIFGIDEQITIRIHVAKLSTQPEKIGKKNESTLKESEINIPYRRI